MFIHPSFREGLPVAVMEAMAGGTPVICSNIRGNADLIDAKGGEIFSPNSVDECKNAIIKVLERNLESLGDYNSLVAQKFSYQNINNNVLQIYKELF